MAPRREPFDFVAQSGPFVSWFCSARIALYRGPTRNPVRFTYPVIVLTAPIARVFAPSATPNR